MTVIVSLILLTAMYWTSLYTKEKYFINLSPSLPYGVYQINKPDRFKRGDIVIFNPPKATAKLIFNRKWLPQGWPLLKHIGAIAGDTYCIKSFHHHAHQFYINDKYAGPVADQDSQGLSLIHIEGCHVVGKDNFLPVSTYIKNSFDGRYFGEISLSSIRGIAVPKYTF